MSNKKYNVSDLSFLSLAGRSIKVPMAATVAVWETALDLAEEFKDAAPLITQRVKGLGRSIDAGLVTVEAATMAAVNSGLEKKLSKEDWRDPTKREDAIFSLFNSEEDSSSKGEDEISSLREELNSLLSTEEKTQILNQMIEEIKRYKNQQGS